MANQPELPGIPQPPQPPKVPTLGDQLTPWRPHNSGPSVDLEHLYRELDTLLLSLENKDIQRATELAHDLRDQIYRNLR